MNINKFVYFNYLRFRGSRLPDYYEELLSEDRAGVPADTTNRLLVKLLTHCRSAVPYYSNLMGKTAGSFIHDPQSYISRLPVLTKDTIRQYFEQLKSRDLHQRRWYFNTSGGSTGEPVKLIQDQEFGDRSQAIALVFSKWAGGEVGYPEIRLWGSDREVFQGTIGIKAKFFNLLQRTTYLNAFLMTPDKMREFLSVINNKRPGLIIAYAQAIYELAAFAEQEQIPVFPQRAIITSAGTLHLFMKEKIESVFQCRVFNRYGSRETGGIACQCPAGQGLHVAPWGNYIEIADDDGDPVPAGTEGNILVTSLTNYAMPLIRYKIGDRGVLSGTKCCSCGRTGQILERVSGRITDNFRTRSGRIIPGEYFVHLIGVVLNEGLVKKFQIIQKSYDQIVVRIVPVQPFDPGKIIEKIKLVMDETCEVVIEYMDDISPGPSGKFRYTISEVPAND